MYKASHNTIVSFSWLIAAAVLCDLDPSTKKPAARAKPRGANTTSGNGASGRQDVGELIDLIAKDSIRKVLELENATEPLKQPTPLMEKSEKEEA